MDSASSTQQNELAVNRTVEGRRDSEGQEVVIKLKPLKKAIADLINLKGKADDAKDSLNDAVKSVAEQSGLLASVVRKLVNARSGTKFAEEKRKVDQLGLVFEEIGEETMRNMDVGNGRPAQPKLSAADSDGNADAPIGDGTPPASDVFAGTDIPQSLAADGQKAPAAESTIDKLSKKAADAATKPLSVKAPRPGAH